ncbi:unnamed protein product [Anisakis simplex]|uniref:SH3 domain-containing protein n=1 Tax=Anisakis simplex TaxID=6269 RepID=A0A0M3JBT1_ANISI|nr:unnamed protein product [Anisakis simplex]
MYVLNEGDCGFVRAFDWCAVAFRITTNASLLPSNEAHMVDNMAKDHPIGPGDRVKLEDRKDQFGAQADDGRLVVPGGEYAENAGMNIADCSMKSTFC